MPAFFAASPSAPPTSSPQNTASEVGTDATAQRRSHPRSSSICSASFAFSGSPAGAASQALISAGIGFSNHGR